MKKIAFLLALAALPAFADLGSEIRSASGWVGYTVPIADGRHTMCAFDTPASALLVMYRVESGVVENVRISSPECPRDHELRWIANVDPGESRRNLRKLIDETDVGKKAVAALALHRDADDDLIALARRHPSREVRGAALFWVGNRAGRLAAETLRDAVDNDPDASVKSKAVFGIAQLPNERSVPILIELLKTHRSREVRKKAAFWLSQKDDPRALAAFEEILER